jgi:hypothetical protein
VNDDARALSLERIEGFLNAWDSTPAFVMDAHLDVVLSNRLARAVLPAFSPGFNLARYVFLDSSTGSSRAGSDRTLTEVAAILRDSLDRHGEDVEFLRLVGELAALSATFSVPWAEERPPSAGGVVDFDEDGNRHLKLEYHRLLLPGGHGDVLVVWRAVDPGSQGTLTELIRTVSDE